MGRVDDAMRRAAEEQRAGRAGGVAATTEMEQVHAGDAFPEELRSSDDDPEPGMSVSAPDAVPEHSAAVQTASPHRRLIDVVDRRLTGKLVADHTMPPASREQYRRLAATLHHAQVDAGMKVVMIASAVASEGKTLTATNLALTFSESYKRRVLLIDADLRRPSIHGLFQIPGTPGLSDGLMSLEHEHFALHQVTEHLTILPGGRPSSDPMAGLTSGRMKRLIAEARESFDWIIIDTPPVGLMTDANLLASMADGAILVVKAGSTSYQLAQRAVEAIGRDRLLGAVLNRADVESFGGHRYYYNYYYGAPEETKSFAKRLVGRFGRRNA